MILYELNMLKLEIHTDDFSNSKESRVPRIIVDDGKNDPGNVENTGVETITWKDVVKASDVVFFCLTLVAFITSLTVYFIYSQQDATPL